MPKQHHLLRVLALTPLVLAITGCGSSSHLSSPSVIMPNVVGMTLLQADQRMHAAGVADWAVQCRLSIVKPGTVLIQSPAAQTTVGSADVVITVAKPAHGAVPGTTCKP